MPILCYSVFMSTVKDIVTNPPTSAATKAFPSAKDAAAWAKLSPAEKRAIVAADEAAGFASGVAPRETAAAHIARVKSAS